MDGFITAMVAEVTSAELFGVLTSLVPWVGTMILFALAVHFIRKSVKGAGSGKAKI
jgi:hypothetical protein